MLPLRPRDKRPLTANGLLDASTDPAVIATWWSQWPDANIGLRTGVAFDALDLDGPEGLASLAIVAPSYKHDGPVSATGKGYHLLFAVTEAKNGANLRPKIDFRGQNGYIVAPPSIHPLGHGYAWLKSPDLPLPQPPYWLYELILPPPPAREPTPANPTIERARDLLDVETELARLGVTLQRKGSRLVGLCPFHSERTPSLTVYPNQTWFCFGCGAWGDALNVFNYSRTGKLR